MGLHSASEGWEGRTALAEELPHICSVTSLAGAVTTVEPGCCCLNQLWLKPSERGSQAWEIQWKNSRARMDWILQGKWKVYVCHWACWKASLRYLSAEVVQTYKWAACSITVIFITPICVMSRCDYLPVALFSITSQKSSHRNEVMISRCETSLILVLSRGFNSNLSFQLLRLFIMSISVLHFGATHSFQVRTELGSLWSPSCCWAGCVAADGHMCCLSCTPSRERVIEDVLHAPAEHSCTVKCSYFSSCFCLKYLIVSFPYLHSRVCQ